MDDKQLACSVSAESLEQARRRMSDEIWEQANALGCDTFEDFVEEQLTAYAALVVKAEREQWKGERRNYQRMLWAAADSQPNAQLRIKRVSQENWSPSDCTIKTLEDLGTHETIVLALLTPAAAGEGGTG